MHTVYAIDLGLAKPYKDPQTGKHIPYRDGKGLVGTARYASIKTQLGIEQSRRDDLVSLGFVLMYFSVGALPWQGVRGRNRKEKQEKIKMLKTKISFDSLCKDVPEEFCTFLEKCHKLAFDEEPNYAVLREMFSKLFDRRGFVLDYRFDWLKIKEKTPVSEGKKEGAEQIIVGKECAVGGKDNDINVVKLTP